MIGESDRKGVGACCGGGLEEMGKSMGGDRHSWKACCDIRSPDGFVIV